MHILLNPHFLDTVLYYICYPYKSMQRFGIGQTPFQRLLDQTTASTSSSSLSCLHSIFSQGRYFQQPELYPQINYNSRCTFSTGQELEPNVRSKLIDAHFARPRLFFPHLNFDTLRLRGFMGPTELKSIRYLI